jgi:hypothetical protein
MTTQQEYFLITKEEIGRISGVVVEDAEHEYKTGMIETILSRPHIPAPDEGIISTDKNRLWCGERCYACSRSTARTSILADRENLHKVICDLYDAGFKNPLITFEAAVSYLENPTVSGHPEKQQMKSPKKVIDKMAVTKSKTDEDDDGYIRIPFDCLKCRREHSVSELHVGPDPKANCGKCIAKDVMSKVKFPTPEE